MYAIYWVGTILTKYQHPRKANHVIVKSDPPKLVPPGTNFAINKDLLELILLQNMDSV